MTSIDHDKLNELLRAVGMKVFVEILYPALTHDRSVTAIELTRKYPTYAEFTQAAQNTRLSKAKKIFNNGWQREALITISLSSRTDPSVRSKAEELGLEYNKV